MKWEVASGAYLEKPLAAPTHTSTIPQTHDYVEPEWRALDGGFLGSVLRL
jgi:hypothetical protein